MFIFLKAVVENGKNERYHLGKSFKFFYQLVLSYKEYWLKQT